MQDDSTLDIAFIRALPKPELHIHLEGSLQPATMLTLARRHAMLDRLPADTIAGLQRWATFSDFTHFRQVVTIMKELLRDADDFATVAYACGRDMAEQNIWYREATVTPYAHTHYLGKGLDFDAVMSGLERGRQQARQEFGVEIRWVFDIPRNRAFPEGGYDPAPAEQTLAYALAGKPYGVVGLGLGGNEATAPPHPFADVFIAAREAGLLSLPHAGEHGGPDSIWGAIDELHADRIGHGVRAVEDPALMTAIRERRIPLEVSVSSNVCLGVFASASDHPFPLLEREGIVVTVNSDDPPLFNTTLCQEYAILVEAFGFGHADLGRLARTGFEVCGAEPALRTALVSRFDAWVAAHSDDFIH